jgi:hypothetical protein
VHHFTFFAAMNRTKLWMCVCWTDLLRCNRSCAGRDA